MYYAFLLRAVPAPGSRGAAESTEVLEIVAGGGQKEGVASGSDDAEVDYLQGEDSEIVSAFSGKVWSDRAFNTKKLELVFHIETLYQ